MYTINYRALRVFVAVMTATATELFLTQITADLGYKSLTTSTIIMVTSIVLASFVTDAVVPRVK